MTIIILDSGSLNDLQITGPNSYEIRSDASESFIFKNYVCGELPTSFEKNFWNQDIESSDAIRIDVTRRTQDMRYLILTCFDDQDLEDISICWSRRSSKWRSFRCLVRRLALECLWKRKDRG